MNRLTDRILWLAAGVVIGGGTVFALWMHERALQVVTVTAEPILPQAPVLPEPEPPRNVEPDTVAVVPSDPTVPPRSTSPRDSAADNVVTGLDPREGIAGRLGRPIIPVAGILPRELVDTYTAARSEGREHNAIDIIAPRGTPVLAALPGRIERLFTSERGGLTIYQRSADSDHILYYAHLDAYAAGIHEGMSLQAGDVIGFVGTTGNAGPDNPHLHFAIWRITDPKRIWDGENVNPYPLLRGTSVTGG